MHTSSPDPSPTPSPRTSPAPKPQPYAIAVPAAADLAHLHSKLAQMRLPDELAAAGRAYGAPLADITRLVSHWLHGYDWRAHEARINAALPQFTLDVAVSGCTPRRNPRSLRRSDTRSLTPPSRWASSRGCTRSS